MAEFVEAESSCEATPAAQAYLEVVGQMLVDFADEVLVGIVVIYALVELYLVARVIQQHGVGMLPVAPGTPGLLEVSLDRVGAVVVDDHAHVRLVDTHAKGIGGDDDTLGVVLPLVLVLVLDGRVEPRMEVVGRDVGRL